MQPFLFESSEGSSILHQGTLRIRKRLQHGLSLGGTYTYSKSIDDASSIGGGATVVAQNDLDINAERGLSSFDQRQRFVADYLYDLPFGKDKKWLTGNGVAQTVFGGFALSGNVTLASGFPFSPRFFGTATDLSRGVTGATRPDLVPGQSIQLANPTIQDWFNTAAFVAPAGVFGTAGRNTIIGPGTVSFNMSVSKTVQVKEMQSMELRISATNVFNNANFTSIDSTVGSRTFGQVIAAGADAQGATHCKVQVLVMAIGKTSFSNVQQMVSTALIAALLFSSAVAQTPAQQPQSSQGRSGALPDARGERTGPGERGSSRQAGQTNYRSEAG